MKLTTNQIGGAVMALLLVTGGFTSYQSHENGVNAAARTIKRDADIKLILENQEKVLTGLRTCDVIKPLPV